MQLPPTPPLPPTTPHGLTGAQFSDIMMMFIAGATFVLLVKLVFDFLKSRRGPTQVVPFDPELRGRIERIEHAVEAIALETERLSEGQRFTTRLLAERAERDRAALEK